MKVAFPYQISRETRRGGRLRPASYERNDMIVNNTGREAKLEWNSGGVAAGLSTSKTFSRPTRLPVF